MKCGDEQWMGEALRLARRGEGKTRPNPPVGAVVVKGGAIVGAGYHLRAGGPHAEIVALAKAKGAAKGATLYVTLEPCSTHGRTPPCTEAILASGVTRVVVSAIDPNPVHRGRGIRKLRSAGVEVLTGVLRADGENLLRPFAKRIVHGLPFVTLKMAMTFDGRIADSTGASRWITSPAARRIVTDLRKRVDAILVGARTADIDDPSLRVAGTKDVRAWRVVADSTGRLPLNSKVLADGAADRTIVATTNRSSATRRAALEATGANVWLLRSKGRHVSLKALLRKLASKGCMHVLCEGGGELACALIESGQVDQYMFFVAPKFLGSSDAAQVLSGAGWPLQRAPRVEFTSVEKCGPDILIRAVPDGGR